MVEKLIELINNSNDTNKKLESEGVYFEQNTNF